ncbi:MAG TPA: hypothetical protein VGA56_09680, partial [Opitutaceae bacterium]
GRAPHQVCHPPWVWVVSGWCEVSPLPYGRVSDWCVSGMIDATDRRIDRLVYELSGLTDEEIRFVEDATAR